MSKPDFHLPDVPTELSVNLLSRTLSEESMDKGVSPKNYAHRARVIRQQSELLARQVAQGADEAGKHQAKQMRKASRPLDHRDEGGQG